MGSFLVFIPVVTKGGHKFLVSLSYKAKPCLKLGVAVHTCNPGI